jgi:uncharacterized protein
MWNNIAKFILKFRLALIILIGIITLFMGYKAKNIEMTYDFAKVVPSTDPEMIYFEHFRSMFGEDGNIVVLGIKDSSLYSIENFTRLKYLSEELKRLKGVNNVLSLPLISTFTKDIENKKFLAQPLFNTIPSDQNILDSLLLKASDLKFYEGQIFNSKTGATLIVVTLDKDYVNSKERKTLIYDLETAGMQFSEVTGIDIHYAGLPFVRTMMATKVKSELNFFLILSIIITAIILMFFFRSWDAVVFPMIVIGVMVVWTMGTLALFDYKITLLTGLLPPIIVVIGIPNCVYLLNKYHQEFNFHGNKIKALTRIISKIGIVTLITNFTTAIGFLVLAFTDIVILKEFGLVAGINILATFFVSIILIPAVFSYLPAPNTRKLKHLNFKSIDKALTGLDLLVHRHKYGIFVVTGGVILISIIGLLKVDAVSFMVDDIPEESKIKKDIKFFEKEFSGIMPLEIVIDTGKKKGIMNLSNLQKVDEFEEFLQDLPKVSNPISIVSFVKAARQAYYNGNPAYYSLPNNQDKSFILRYLKDNEEGQQLLSSFTDSTGQVMRISMKVADIGSNKMNHLVHKVIEPKAAQIFEGTDIDVRITGTTLLFTKGNKFLIENLWMSMIMAFCIISIIMAMLFGNFRMILISLIPNMIPLIITAGIMGYFGIPLKPSTALIFSIAFGISVDDSIHFLAKYRQELFNNKFFVPVAVSKSIRETGSSMIYTSIILFSGFVIFAGSDFGGTVALGILTSTTLLIAMFTNLIVLPALLLTFDDGKRKDDFYSLIEHYDEFYQEDEDEEIDISLIKVPEVSLKYNQEQ